MSNPWFRMYSEFAHDPKVQMMNESMQRRYVMLLCMRCSNDLVTLQDEEVAFQLRISMDELAETKALFIKKGFINSAWNLSNWDKRQMVSDTSNARVAKHRALQKEKQTSQGNGDVTLQEQKSNGLEQNRTDTEVIPSLSSAAPTPPAEQEIPKKAKTEAIPACPHESLIDLFAQRLPELPQPVRSLWAAGKNGIAAKARWQWVLTACHESGERKGQRLAQTAEEALAWFDRYFRYASRSDLLTGRKGEWMADMGWLMAKGNFEKVISGNYENKLEAA